MLTRVVVRVIGSDTEYPTLRAAAPDTLVVGGEREKNSNFLDVSTPGGDYSVPATPATQRTTIIDSRATPRHLIGGFLQACPTPAPLPRESHVCDAAVGVQGNDGDVMSALQAQVKRAVDGEADFFCLCLDANAFEGENCFAKRVEACIAMIGGKVLHFTLDQGQATEEWNWLDRRPRQNVIFTLDNGRVVVVAGVDHLDTPSLGVLLDYKQARMCLGRYNSACVMHLSNRYADLEHTRGMLRLASEIRALQRSYEELPVSHDPMDNEQDILRARVQALELENSQLRDRVKELEGERDFAAGLGRRPMRAVAPTPAPVDVPAPRSVTPPHREAVSLTDDQRLRLAEYAGNPLEATANGSLRCIVCKVEFQTKRDNVQKHVNGARHRKKLMSKGMPSPTLPDRVHKRKKAAAPKTPASVKKAPPQRARVNDDNDDENSPPPPPLAPPPQPVVPVQPKGVQRSKKTLASKQQLRVCDVVPSVESRKHSDVMRKKFGSASDYMTLLQQNQYEI